MPKSRHNERGELKDAQLNLRVTATAKKGIQELADSMGISVSDLVDKIGWGDLQILPLSGELWAS